MKRLVIAVALGAAAFSSGVSSQQPGAMPREQAVRIAEQALHEECEAPTECHFSPSRLEGGWSILVWFCRRNERGGCEYILGGSDNKFVFVKDDGTIRIVTGS